MHNKGDRALKMYVNLALSPRFAVLMVLSFIFHLAAPQVSQKVVGIDTR